MTVYLVGCGPGDPALLTLRAAELIRAADAIAYDRLVDQGVLALARSDAALHYVGKGPGGTTRQEEIDELVLALAARHETVLRLKGGDPYVFGRGGEEVLALQRAGIPFEVVPGVSSVNGVLAYAGIPLTHRGLAASFTVVTGHGAGRPAAAGPADLDWDALARVGGTLVVLMGVAHRKEIAERLIAGGRDPATPAAVVEHGTSHRQRTWRTTLGGLGETEPGSPAVVVVGEVAALDLGFFESRPLFGWRVVVTRAREQSSALAARLRSAGAEPVEVPTIEIEAPSDGGESLRQAVTALDTFDWVAFTSANAVARVFAELRDARQLAGLRVAAIGEATAAALRAHGVEADLVPGSAVAEALVAAFPEGMAAPADGVAPGRPDDNARPREGPAERSAGARRGTGGGRPRVLLPQAAAARPALADGLSARGFEVVAVEAYRTTNPPAVPDLAASLRSADAITFSSSSAVDGLVAAYGIDALPQIVVTIGPVTSATVRDLGVHVDGEAEEASADGLVAALVRVAGEGG